jgi:hypothetical protein
MPSYLCTVPLSSSSAAALNIQFCFLVMDDSANLEDIWSEDWTRLIIQNFCLIYWKKKK